MNEFQTIAQFLKIKEFPFSIKNQNGQLIYSEYSDGFWYKYEYDSNGNEILCENSDGFWSKSEYDSNGNKTRYEDSSGVII